MEADVYAATEHPSHHTRGGVGGIRMLAVRGGGLFDGLISVRGPVPVLMEAGRIVDVDTSGATPPDRAQLVDLAPPRYCPD